MQVDVVGVRGDGFTELGECKCGSVSRATLEREPAAKAQRWPNPLDHTVSARGFVRQWKGRRPPGLRSKTWRERCGPCEGEAIDGPATVRLVMKGLGKS